MKLFKKQRHNQDSFKRLIHQLSGMSEADLNKVNQFEIIKQDQNFILEGGAGSGKTYSLISIIENISIEEPKQSIKIVYRERSALFFHVFIRETAQFFIYKKEVPELNRYMRGRELIRQLTNDSQTIPKRKRPTIDTLQKKIEEINLLIELDTENKSYQEVKDEIFNDIARLDLTITELQDHIAHLNKVTEVLLNLNNNDIENRRLARYDNAKMSLTAAIKLEQVEKEIEIYQIKLDKSIDDNEYLIRRLEKFVKILNEIDSSKNELKFEHSEKCERIAFFGFIDTKY